jgi:hypothetical protein
MFSRAGLLRQTLPMPQLTAHRWPPSATLRVPLSHEGVTAPGPTCVQHHTPFLLPHDSTE